MNDLGVSGDLPLNHDTANRLLFALEHMIIGSFQHSACRVRYHFSRNGAGIQLLVGKSRMVAQIFSSDIKSCTRRAESMV